MTDREMLQLAAKAAGIDVVRSRLDDPLSRDFLVNASVRNPHQVSGPWNPLTDDGDALRLAVKVELSPSCFTTAGLTIVSATDRPFTELEVEEEHNGDPLAATRRAIVRAAAEIGKGMK